jgi:hypothetical protein
MVNNTALSLAIYAHIRTGLIATRFFQLFDIEVFAL